MRVLIVSQYFWPENFRVNDLCAELVCRGHTVTVLTGVPNYPEGRVFESYIKAPGDFTHYAGASVLRAPMIPRGRGSLRLIINYVSFVIGASFSGLTRLRDRDFDVIFVFEPSPVTVGLPAILIGKLKKVPVVFWALDLWPETLAAVGVVKSPRILGWVGHLVHFIYDRCALVLGQSQGFLQYIRRYCSNPSKVRYFPSWAEEVFSDSEVMPAPEASLRRDLFNIVFAGNIGEAQDMPALLEAAETLKAHQNIRWLIVGDGRKLEWLQAEVIQRGLQASVLLLGRHPVERMPSFYAHADALLVSLKRDPVFAMTIPGKVQSYLMTGVPLLGMLDGEGAAVIRNAGAGLTAGSGDSQGLAAAVLELMALPATARAEMGRRGRDYAQREFGRRQLIDRLEAMFFEVSTSYKATEISSIKQGGA